MAEFNYCPHCGRSLPPDSQFCPGCGVKLGESPAPRAEKTMGLGDVIDLLASWAGVLLIALLTVNVFIALAVSPEIISNIGDFGYTLFILVPFIVDIYTATGPLAIAFYVAIVAILVASWGLLIWNSKRAAKEVTGDFSGERSPLFKVTTLFAAILFFNYVFILLIEMGGTTPSTPGFGALPDWYLFYVLMNAAVYEELICRVLFIGVPISIMVLMNRREGSPLRALIGGTGMGDAEKVLIIISSVLFAFGHLEGWDVWKIFPTFLAGLAMGYLFVKYGLYAAVMFHFSFNFLSAPALYTDSLLAMAFTGVLIIGFLGLGVPYFFIYAKAAIESVTGKDLSLKGLQGPQEAPSRPREDPYPMPRAKCPSCGNDGAVYQRGELQCPRCGERY